MKRVKSIEDQMNMVERYELPDGRMVCFASDYVSEVGLSEALRGAGVEPPTDRVPVYQDGNLIGTVPAVFDPDRIQSTSFLYDPRPGDFTREGARWLADPMIGPGDLECIPGFKWKRDTTQ